MRLRLYVATNKITQAAAILITFLKKAMKKSAVYIYITLLFDVYI